MLDTIRNFSRQTGLGKLLVAGATLMQLGCATLQQSTRTGVNVVLENPPSYNSPTQGSGGIGAPCETGTSKKLPKLPNACKYMCSDGVIVAKCWS